MTTYPTLKIFIIPGSCFQYNSVKIFLQKYALKCKNKHYELKLTLNNFAHYNLICAGHHSILALDHTPSRHDLESAL